EGGTVVVVPGGEAVVVQVVQPEVPRDLEDARPPLLDDADLARDVAAVVPAGVGAPDPHDVGLRLWGELGEGAERLRQTRRERARGVDEGVVDVEQHAAHGPVGRTGAVAAGHPAHDPGSSRSTNPIRSSTGCASRTSPASPARRSASIASGCGSRKVAPIVTPCAGRSVTRTVSPAATGPGRSTRR